MPEESFSTHLCGPGDRAEQARLFNACFKKDVTADHLAWRYDRGPHGAAISLVTRPEHVEGGEAVSGYACSPRLALVEGDESTLAPVGETGDVMTHPEWRKRGLFSELDRRAMAEAKERGWPLVFGLPNRRSAHIFLQTGWERVGTVRPWSFLLRADAAARAEEFKEGRLRRLLVPWNAARCARARRRLGTPAEHGLEARALERFPDEVVELSRAVERRFPFMVRRDADYLNWRFADAPSGLHGRVGLFRDGELAGYAVVQRPRPGGGPGSGLGFLVDVLAPRDDDVRACVAAGLQALDEAGASVVQATAIDGSWWRDVLAGSGFLPPREENHLIVILHVHDPAHPLAGAGRDASRWYLTDGDRDDETMG